MRALWSTFSRIKEDPINGEQGGFRYPTETNRNLDIAYCQENNSLFNSWGLLPSGIAAL